ncbi:hypothetical protein SAMN03084138_01130 [Enterovibrio norvegicus DSM 15893]|uniref:Uncharacterized protein n=1 Tax=Enterovibrio norvegicus DSM 15893 TaxID=1121869 RepID=A0A1I5LY57_9GAMM|nr:hypothetical protein SAMN03084138_01130 [Enterovibrio norvegicus DSM 15893]
MSGIREFEYAQFTDQQMPEAAAEWVNISSSFIRTLTVGLGISPSLLTPN